MSMMQDPKQITLDLGHMTQDPADLTHEPISRDDTMIQEKGHIGTNVTCPADKDGVIGFYEPIRLTEMQASGDLSQRQGAPEASISVFARNSRL